MNEPIFVGKDIEFDKIDNEEKIKAIIKCFFPCIFDPKDFYSIL